MQFIQSPAALKAAARALSGHQRLFIDTEFESSRESRTLCLLQISVGEEVYLIDSLRLPSLADLRPIFSNPEVEWVLHAGQQDVLLLMEALQLKDIPAIFDTQIAWGLLSPEPSVSLAYLQYKLLGLRTAKAHQADDWKRRPLPQSQLDYAASDIAHLPELRQLLTERLSQKQREQVVLDASRDALVPTEDPLPDLSLDSFRNAWQLDPPSQAALRAILSWYNKLPHNKKVSTPVPKTLLAIASRLPETVQDLARIKGVPPNWCKRYGAELVTLMNQAAAATQSADFIPIDPPAYATFEEIRLDAYLATLRAEVCTELVVAPELVMPTRVLRRLRQGLLSAGKAGAARELEGWRYHLCSETIQAYLTEHPPPLLSP